MEISVSGNSVYVVWVDRVRDYMVRVVSGVGNDEIFFRKSTDGGNTFSKAVKLSNNTEISTNPQLAIDGPNVYVVWYDKDNASNKIVFLKSVDGGIKFGKIVNLSNTSEFSYQPDLAACGGSVYAAWSSQVGGITRSNYILKCEFPLVTPDSMSCGSPMIFPWGLVGGLGLSDSAA